MLVFSKIIWTNFYLMSQMTPTLWLGNMKESSSVLTTLFWKEDSQSEHEMKSIHTKGDAPA